VLGRLGVTLIKGIIRVQPQVTTVIVFYDLRDAIRAAAGLDGMTMSELNGNGVRLAPALGANGAFPSILEDKEMDRPLQAQYIDKTTLEKVLVAVP
jgi:hypothetical protein